MQSKTVASSAEAPTLDTVDVVHIHGWHYPLAPAMAMRAVKCGKPYILSPHGCLTFGPYNKPTWSDRLRFAWRTRRLIRGASCVAALHPREEHDLLSRRVSARVRVLPYGLNFDAYATAGTRDTSRASSSRSLLVLGSLHPRGGCVALLKAIAEIGPDADGWNVVLAGTDDGDWRKMLESAVRRKKGDDRVTFADAPTVEAQQEWLSRASLLVSPGLHIGLPVSIMQAAASGVPAIASTCVAPPGLEGAIRVFEPRREALRETLRSVLRLTDESRAEMAEKARSLGRRLFDWSVLADRYAGLYKEVA